MELHIPETLSDTLHEIGDIGGKHAYLVGGSVRDILLKRPSFDIDVVVEGDAVQVAKEIQKRWNGTLQVHPQFGTATVTPANPEKPKVDFVSARCETYQKPGTLPKVERGTITEDLLRRDFSINALAMCLDVDVFGRIIDKTGGLDDLKTGVIRVLHDNSYTDDPTRIFRAYRYAGRYNFHIADTDVTLIKQAIPLLAQLSGERIRNEIDNVLLEDNAAKIVQELAELGVFETISPGWKISTMFSCEFQTAQQAISWASGHIADEDIQPNILRWMALFGIGNSHNVPMFQIEALCFKLLLEHQLRKIVRKSQAAQHGVSLDQVDLSVLEKLGFELSKNTIFECLNGKWCIVDSEEKVTLVCGDGNLYKVETPITVYRHLLPVLDTLTETTVPSKIYQVLKPFPLEALVLGYSDSNLLQMQRNIIGDYLLTLRKIQPIITGNDLIQWGEKPGKNFESILWNLFQAQLDGIINTKLEGYSYFKDQTLK